MSKLAPYVALVGAVVLAPVHGTWATVASDVLAVYVAYEILLLRSLVKIFTKALVKHGVRKVD